MSLTTEHMRRYEFKSNFYTRRLFSYILAELKNLEVSTVLSNLSETNLEFLQIQKFLKETQMDKQ